MPSTAAQPLDKSGDRVRRMFAEIAPRYDLLNHLLSLNIDKSWRRATVRRVPPLGGTPILDLCTGTGDLALEYDRAGGGKTPVIGADFCEPMLDLARQKGKYRGDRVRWELADALALPFPDDGFQIVSVGFGLRNVADTDAGLQEMRRVLQPGGRLAVLEFTTPRRQPLRGAYKAYFHHVLPRLGQSLMRNSADAYAYLPESVGQFDEYEQLCRRIESAGFEGAEFFPMTFGVATLYLAKKK